MKKSQLRNIIRGMIKEIEEVPSKSSIGDVTECYHQYNIHTSSSGILSGTYFGHPDGGGETFSCTESNYLHHFLGFDVNPNKIVSIKQNSTSTHGWKKNCIEFLGTTNSPGGQFVTISDALMGPAYFPYVIDYNTIQECASDFYKPDNSEKELANKG